eukprot:PhM_4_TR6205/c0_g1_i1/m.78986/K04711/ACER3, YDC1; dihydroceramidase
MTPPPSSPLPDVGYWGPPTSDMDWCENNYAHTVYVAELFNTLSSIPIATFALFGAHLMYKNLSTSSSLLHVVIYLVISVVGFGSMAFHGTLTQLGQALDEVPMLWGAAVLTYAQINVHATASSLFHAPSAAGTLFVCLGTTYLYYTGAGFIFFVLSYSATVALLVVLSARFCLCDPSASSITKRLAATAVTCYVGGFVFFWLPETLLCGNRLHDHDASVFEGLGFHALFHLTSAFGSYTMAMFVFSARIDVVRSRIRYEKMTFGDVGTRSHLVHVCSVPSFGVPLPVVEVISTK